MGERVLVSGAAGRGRDGGRPARRGDRCRRRRDGARPEHAAARWPRSAPRGRRRPGDEADARPLRRRARAGRRAKPDQRAAGAGDRRAVVVIGVGRWRADGHQPLHSHGQSCPPRRLDAARPHAAQKANVADGVRAHVLPLLAAGRIEVPVCDTFPLAEARPPTTASARAPNSARPLGLPVPRDADARRPMIEAVLFDGDQTLWDFEQGHARRAARRTGGAARRSGPARRPTRCPGRTSKQDRADVAAELDRHRVQPGPATRARVLAHAGAGTSGRGWRRAADAALAERLAACYFDRPRPRPRAVPRHVPCLQALRGHYRLGLLSNGSRLPEPSASAGTSNRSCSPRTIEWPSPTRDCSKWSKRELGLDAPACVLVGDHPLNDIVGAKRAGWHAVWLDRERAGRGRVPASARQSGAARCRGLDARRDPRRARDVDAGLSPVEPLSPGVPSTADLYPEFLTSTATPLPS